MVFFQLKNYRCARGTKAARSSKTNEQHGERKTFEEGFAVSQMFLSTEESAGSEEALDRTYECKIIMHHMEKRNKCLTTRISKIIFEKTCLLLY